MKDIIIGDEHCRGKFKTIYEQVYRNLDIRYIVCVGDYLDPYDPISLEQRMSFFNSIVKIAAQDSRVKLLLGNHDMHYLLPTGDKSRRDSFNAVSIKKAFFDNLNLFQIALELDKDTVVSHAGISPAWLKKHNYHSIDEINSSILNSFVDTTKIAERSSVRYYDGDFSGYGDDILQPPTWIRPRALLYQAKDWKWKTQIVGHTRTDSVGYEEYILGKFSNGILFNGEIVKIPIEDKQLIMVDTGDNMNYFTFGG